jgi:hypothetical protein
MSWVSEKGWRGLRCSRATTLSALIAPERRAEVIYLMLTLPHAAVDLFCAFMAQFTRIGELFGHFHMFKHPVSRSVDHAWYLFSFVDIIGPHVADLHC